MICRKHFMSTVDMPNGIADIAKPLTLCHCIHLVSSWMIECRNTLQYSSLSCGYHVTQVNLLFLLTKVMSLFDQCYCNITGTHAPHQPWFQPLGPVEDKMAKRITTCIVQTCDPKIQNVSRSISSCLATTACH
jgi:hypothetical protein